MMDDASHLYDERETVMERVLKTVIKWRLVAKQSPSAGQLMTNGMPPSASPNHSCTASPS